MGQESIINWIILRELNFLPETIHKQEVGICNEVYLISGAGGSFILRMNEKENYMAGTTLFLPILRSLKIKVPEIIAECYDLRSCGFYYQIQTIVEGVDLECVMEDLTVSQIEDLAIEIKGVINKFWALPCENYFGAWSGSKEERFNSQTEVLRVQLNMIAHRLPKWVSDIYENLITCNLTYFNNVSPNLYFDDMASKNVMIVNGKFSGLVDLDFMRRGDILDLIGRFQGCWQHSSNGRLFTNVLLDNLELTLRQKRYVLIYAILNLINWVSEENELSSQIGDGFSSEMLEDLQGLIESLDLMTS